MRIALCHVVMVYFPFPVFGSSRIGSEPESDVNATEEQYSSAEGQGKPYPGSSMFSKCFICGSYISHTIQLSFIDR